MGTASARTSALKDASTSALANAKKIVVIGNGMVGHRFCESLSELDASGVYHLVVFGEETRPAYDRVHLSSFFSGQTAEDLAVTSREWYAERGFELHTGDPVLEIDCSEHLVVSKSGRREHYDALVLAMGSAPFVPPIPGIEKPGVFVYRTIDDLEAIRAWAARSDCSRGVVIGGGLLGLEAAKASVDLGLETHVVEHGDRLMPRQVDESGGALLQRAIESLGLYVHTAMSTQEIYGAEVVEGLLFADDVRLDTDLVLVSAGIRARDELGRDCGLAVGERGGIIVDDRLATSDPEVFAIGECAQHAGTIYGLVGPGYEMAETLARRLTGDSAEFHGADLSTKLKLLGVDVASFGEPFADLEGIAARKVVIEDGVAGVYQKLVISADGERLLGGILVGDATPYLSLLRTVRERKALPQRPHQLLTGVPDANSDASKISDEAQVCSCNNVTKGRILAAIREGELSSAAEVKACTKAGTGCGGCLPLVKGILDEELARAGRRVDSALCEHFPYSRPELFQIVKLGRIPSFEAILASHGSGAGCEVCRPAIASILSSTWNDGILNHSSIQDTNDRFLANIQRGGTYSVIPRVPGGEITPEKLIVLGEVAKKHGLYCKITGGQRVDLLGARVEELPGIWSELVEAGFESGHAYGKALRTVKSCVGKSWCRFGVQDSTAFAIRLEERYRGIRSPHKLKSAVSGCVRECAEAQSKDFGLIATESGWNLYVCGNGGANPRHAELLATDLSEEEAIRLIDRFLIYYIQTANPLERTASWLERLEGGLERLRAVVVEDALGLGPSLEQDMETLVASYSCEWREVVENPERQRHFRHFSNSGVGDSELEFVVERGQRQPAEWNSQGESTADSTFDTTPEEDWVWHPVGVASSFDRDSGRAVHVPGGQVAIFHLAAQDRYFATENRCPHQKDMVLARGLLGTQAGVPKVACPLHKKTFSLETGKGLSDPEFCVQTFPVELRGHELFVKLPPMKTLAPARSEKHP